MPTATGGCGRRCGARASEGAAVPGAAADGRQRDPGRQAPRQAVAHDQARSRRRAARRTSSSGTSPPRRPTGCGSADFTYLRTWEGVVYLRFVIDVFSRMIVGWQFATHMRTDAGARRAADGARARARRARTSSWCTTPTAGSQYTSADYTQALDDHDVAGVGRLGRRLLRQRAGRKLRRHLQDRADRRPRLAHPRAGSSSRSSSGSAGTTTSGCTPRSATSRRPSTRLTGERRRPWLGSATRRPPGPSRRFGLPPPSTRSRALCPASRPNRPATCRAPGSSRRFGLPPPSTRSRARALCPASRPTARRRVARGVRAPGRPRSGSGRHRRGSSKLAGTGSQYPRLCPLGPRRR